MASRYLIALGSNVRHHRHGSPRQVLQAALAAIAGEGVRLECVSPTFPTLPLGPSRRRFANAAAVVESALAPDELLALLKRIEQQFGRRPTARWAARVLDVDIILWDGGCWSSPWLTVPHPSFRQRAFVLRPAAAIAPSWRDPLTGLTLRQLTRRRDRP